MTQIGVNVCQKGGESVKDGCGAKGSRQMGVREPEQSEEIVTHAELRLSGEEEEKLREIMSRLWRTCGDQAKRIVQSSGLQPVWGNSKSWERMS